MPTSVRLPACTPSEDETSVGQSRPYLLLLIPQPWKALSRLSGL